MEERKVSSCFDEMLPTTKTVHMKEEASKNPNKDLIAESSNNNINNNNKTIGTL